MTDTRPAYSFLHDSRVPRFDPPEYFTVMDASCGLCASGAAWIAKYDRTRGIKIIPMQSELGSALLRHSGMDPGDPLSWLYYRRGEAFTSLDAIVRLGADLGGIWQCLRVLSMLPRSIQNQLYGYVARNRYRFMGRADLCSSPDPRIQARLLQ